MKSEEKLKCFTKRIVGAYNVLWMNDYVKINGKFCTPESLHSSGGLRFKTKVSRNQSDVVISVGNFSSFLLEEKSEKS